MASVAAQPDSPVGLLVEQVGRVPRTVLRRGASLLGAIARPLGVVADGVRAARSLGQALGPGPAGVQVLAVRSGEWHFETLDVPLAALKAGARAAGGSVNDGFLAAVLGGFRRYHEALGEPVPASLPIGIPISLRSVDDPQGGNRFTGARLDGPLAEPDPAARIRAIRRFVLQAREGASVDAVGVFAPALTWMPAPVLGVVSGRMTRRTTSRRPTCRGSGTTCTSRGRRSRDVPLRPAARLRGDDHADQPRGDVLHRAEPRPGERGASGGAGGGAPRGPGRVTALAP